MDPVIPGHAKNPLSVRVAVRRDELGLTNADLVARSGLSESYIRNILAGGRNPTRQGTLAALAIALEYTDIAELTGGLPWSTGNVSGPADLIHPATARLATLMHRPALTATRQAPPDLDGLQDRIDALWQVWHSSPYLYSEVATDLPGLLGDVEDAALAFSRTAPGEQAGRRHAARLRAQANHLARQWLRKVQRPDLAQVAAERALTASQDADDPVLLAFSAWNFIGLHNATGRYDDADAIAADAVTGFSDVADSTGDDRLRGMIGALMLYQSIAVARAGDEDRSWALWERADVISRRLGVDFWDPWTTFSGINVEFYKVALQFELRDNEAMLRAAARVDVTKMPCRERQARYLIDVAAAHLDSGSDDAALAVLGQAERTGPEEVAYSHYAREAVHLLLRRNRATDREALRALGERIGVAA